ncbi:hypothetical protein V1517DRAFT_319584 [Lipomyces orientalis]|uniref:Uncharacterized protein n=1 Tax=Lipomyces orientalis TaxID=1233043 RepID=A0ACC3TU65_9ASCO
MSFIFRNIVWAGYVPKSRIAAIIIALLYLLEPVSAYVRGILCVSAVFHSYDTYFEGSVQTVVEEGGLVVYQEGVDLTTVIVPNDLYTYPDLSGSAKVPTIFKVGVHTCTLYGQWQSGGIPPYPPQVSKVTCPGTTRVWTITSSDPNYSKFFQIGNDSPNPYDYYMNSYTLYGKYCGSY